MASTFSNLGLNLQATGENSGTWGSITNVNLQEIDNAISGVFNLTITGSTTLAFTTNSSSTTFTDESGRNKTIILAGALSATTVTLSVPNIEKDYVIINNSGGTVTVSSGGSTTVSIATGSKNYVIVDPTTTSVISAVPAASPGGSNTQVQFNNSGSFGAISSSTAGFILTSNGTTTTPSFQANTGISAGKSIAFALVFG
jgi:ABC-type Fe3+-hydroxamate transport system substrate-binding protein